MISRIITAALCLLPSMACHAPNQTAYHIEISALALEGVKEHLDYVLLPGSDEVVANQLQFREFAQYIDYVLGTRGFLRAEDPDQAQIAIFLSYGISEPTTDYYTYTTPVWGQTGISSSQTIGSASFQGNSATFNEKTKYTPSYGMTGFATSVGETTTYTRHVRLIAYDLPELRNNNNQVELWRTVIISSGSNKDLRRVFPVLAAAAKLYLAKNTQGQVSVKLRDSDGAVKAVRRRSPPATLGKQQ